MIPVGWSHGKACSGYRQTLPAPTSQLDADASRFWETDPEFSEWLIEMERRDNDRDE